VADVPAGSAADPAALAGECVRIMTGAPLPAFADTVVPLEETDRGTAVVEVRQAPPARGRHVRHAGEDVAAGATIARPGDVLTPPRLAAIAAVGATRVLVRPRPAVAVAATGDELVTDGSPLRRGQIHESNSVALAAALARDGATPLPGGPIPDRPDELAAWLDAVTPGADLVVLTGGASVGDHDVVREVLTGRAGGTFRAVRLQPGKPQGWAVWPGGSGQAGGTPVVALPGNPVSALLSYELLVRPLLDRLLGREAPPGATVVAEVGWASPPGRRQLVPVLVRSAPDGRLFVRPSHAGGSASHLPTSLASADGFAIVGEDVTGVRPGDLLGLRWLR
jgi:molybdopterin molybdotransferase